MSNSFPAFTLRTRAPERGLFIRANANVRFQSNLRYNSSICRYGKKATVDERELLARAQESADGFGELFDAYYDRIYSYAYRRVGSSAAAEDIAACVFEDALRGIRRVRWQGKPVAAWLYRIASRRVADHYRDRQNQAAAADERVPAVQGAFDRVAEHAAVWSAIAKLNPREQEIIRLSFFDELSAAEIAGMWNCTTNSVYVRLSRALKRLKAVLEAEDEMG